MAPADPPSKPHDRSASYAEEDGLGEPARVPKGGWRERVRSKRGVGQAIQHYGLVDQGKDVIGL